jgi:hypothetical protein
MTVKVLLCSVLYLYIEINVKLDEHLVMVQIQPIFVTSDDD